MPSSPKSSAASAPRWEVQLLGGFSIQRGGMPVVPPTERAERLLLARLALQPHVEHGRDDLAWFLWPDLDAQGDSSDANAPSQGRARLRRVLSNLNVRLGRDVPAHATAIVSDRYAVRLNAAAFDIDVARFERHRGRREWTLARDAYRGELLPGLHDDWIDDERARLSAAYLHALDRGSADPEAGVTTEDADDEPARPVVPYVTQFFGRDAEMDSVQQALRSHRLVVLQGSGGSGKTRLAVEALKCLRGHDFIAFVDLLHCRTSRQLVESVRMALGVYPGATPDIERIADRLEGLTALLLLDNFEQVASPEGERCVDELLRRMPQLRLLVTSRRALSGVANCALEVAPLTVPGTECGVDAASTSAAVSLFVNRAQAARSDFRLHARNVAGVIEVCRRLDGLPLAIELAAAKIREYTPHRMAATLAGMDYAALARPAGRNGTPSRHGSLESVLEWSWSLLTSRQRDLLHALSVFKGAWTPAQARAVASHPATDDDLRSLSELSLLRWQDEIAGRLRRLALDDSLRAFAQARCPREVALLVRARHRALFVELAEDADQRHVAPDPAAGTDLDEALTTALEDRDDDALLRLVDALEWSWRARGATASVVETLDRAVQCERLGAARRTNLLALLARLLVNAGRTLAARTWADSALGLAGQDPLARASALLARVDVLWRAARAPADQAHARDLVRAATQVLPPVTASASRSATIARAQLSLVGGAMALEMDGDAAMALRLFEQAERELTVLGDARWTLMAAPGKATCLLRQGDLQGTIAMARQAIAAAAAMGDAVTELQLLDRLSSACEEAGLFEEALEACQRQVKLGRAHGMAYYAAYGAWNQCHALARIGRSAQAARLLAFARAFWIEHFGALAEEDERHVKAVRRLIADGIGSALARAEWRQGTVLAPREAWALATGVA